MEGKLKVYLDTSVVSYLRQDDAPERMADTRRLWARFEKGEFDLFLSQTTLDEVERCYEPKRGELYSWLDRIAYKKLPADTQTVAFAHKIIALGVLTSKSLSDCLHIAVAVMNGCDCIASWNFKHLVNIKTIRGVRAIATLEGYKTIDIVTPSILLESEVASL